MRRDGPVAEPVGVLPDAVTQIEAHHGVSVPDAHRRDPSAPHLGRVLEREVRGEVAAHVAAAVVAVLLSTSGSHIVPRRCNDAGQS